jgi:hypothetical protein
VQVFHNSFGDLEYDDVVMRTGAVSEAGRASEWGKRTYIRPAQTVAASSVHPVN